MTEELDNEMFDFKTFLTKVIQKGASDIHLRSDEKPYIRINGNMIKINEKTLTEHDILEVLDMITPTMLKKKVLENYDSDFAYEIKGVARFRVNTNRQLGKIGLVIRIIPFQVPTIEQLHLPSNILEFCKYRDGLCLVTGPTGSGKSTTLATMLDYINQNYRKHIITIEEDRKSTRPELQSRI